MADYKQTNRQMSVTTSLGADKLLLIGFEGSDQMSCLSAYRLDLAAANGNAPAILFDKLLGEEFLVTMWIENPDPNGVARTERTFRGLCREFSQGARDKEFTYYQAEIVPQLWLTTRTAQSRIFQQISVPDILKKILAGYKVTYQLEGTFEKREYCVQYRETDFNFISRLMEEEGIFYFFKNTASGHELVIANSIPAHPDVPGATKVQYNVEEGGHVAQRHVHEWVKKQQVRSGKYTLWDQSFHRPGHDFESKKNTLVSIPVGKVTHKLDAGGNSKFEIYDFPGEFAQRFDGIDKGGGEQGGELGKITPDGARTVGLRMQAETLAGLIIEGSSNCNQFTAGHKFILEKHFDAEGSYLITGVHHRAQGGNSYRSGIDAPFVYSNNFTCIPKDLPFRPQRTTPKPIITGVQTAIVVGPPGEEIFTDKFGRVKVMFPWDRGSLADANSSCWLRVGTSWAGKQWGAMQIPRIGHEVIVQFIEGDPDAPIIIGSVYNAGAMPPYKLPDEKTKSTVKSNSSKGGGGFNEIRFEDKKGSEQVFFHAEKDHDSRVKEVSKEWIGKNKHLIVIKDQFEEVKGDKHLTVKGDQSEKVNGTVSLNVKSDLQQKVGGTQALDVSSDIHLKAGANVVIEAGSSITLKVGGNFIHIGPSGVAIKGTTVLVNSGGAAGSGAGSSPDAAKPPLEADKAKPGSDAPAKRSPASRTPTNPKALVLQQAAKNGTPFCEVCEAVKKAK